MVNTWCNFDIRDEKLRFLLVRNIGIYKFFKFAYKEVIHKLSIFHKIILYRGVVQTKKRKMELIEPNNFRNRKAYRLGLNIKE